MKIIKSGISFFILLSILLFFQISTYHYETIDWDINAFLVTSLEFSRGSLPLENQYENKPPLLFGIFYIFSVISAKNLVFIKLLNDLIIGLILFQTLFLFKEDNRFTINSYVPPVLFSLLISNVWFHPSYSEYLSLLLIVGSYLMYKKANSFFKHGMIGFFVGVSSLINLGTAIYLICYLIIFFLFEDKKAKSILNLLVGFGTIHIIFLVIYFLNGALKEYIMSMLAVPISYGTTEFNFLSSTTVFLNSFLNYNFYIYTLLIFSFSIFIFKIIALLKNFNLSSKYPELVIFIITSIFFYFLAGKGYYHHFIFLLYFVSLTPVWIQNINTKKLIIFVTIFTLIISLSKVYEQTFKNLKNFSSLQDNYPVKVVADKIISEKIDYENIFSTEHILLLYYLNQRNSSYIVHPVLYDYEEITSVLFEYGKISADEKYLNLIKEPKMLEGFEKSENLENYNQLHFENLDLELKLLSYWEKNPSIKILIRKN